MSGGGFDPDRWEPSSGAWSDAFDANETAATNVTAPLTVGRYQAMRDAAPELYEALAYMSEYLASGGQEGDPDIALAKATAAFAKATGADS